MSYEPRLNANDYLNLFCPCNSSETTLFDSYGHVHEHFDYEYPNDYNDYSRLLQSIQETPTEGSKAWEIVYVSIVLFLMFAALISDRIGADHVMMSAVTLLMASKIITVEEGVAGFANEGLLTVLVLFVVAAGISHTGALDWYMGKLLGRPNSTAAAQLKLMIPIAFISAFLNNTPVVVVMIPIVQRWGKNIGVSPQQLLMPLSFASILGGTCTLIGTSTNLVVVGLLQNKYPDEDVSNIGLFDLGKFGVPIAFSGMVYIILFSIFLMPGGAKFIGNKGDTAEVPNDIDDSILLGARLTKWSAAANRTVKRSGLRDTGGLYLVSVHRAATGNVHRAVGQDFVMNVGDILYFTGLVEEFGKFCEENGLEVITNEIEDSVIGGYEKDTNDIKQSKSISSPTHEIHNMNTIASPFGTADDDTDTPLFDDQVQSFQKMELGISKGLSVIPEFDSDIGVTKESLAQSDTNERRRYIVRLQDTIRGMAPLEAIDGGAGGGRKKKSGALTGINAPTKIVSVVDTDDPDSEQQLVLVGVNTRDRSGLLLDISKTLIRLGLNFHRTEAMVIDSRSLSLWRCEVVENGTADIEEIWSVLNAMLEVNSGIEAIKRRGIRIIRAVVPKQSSIVGISASEINFREKYKCAIIAIQRDGASPTEKLSQTRFAVGDILVLQANDDSPLLIQPPNEFYKKASSKGMVRTLSNNSISRFVRKRFGSFSSLESLNNDDDEGSKGTPKKGNDSIGSGDVEDQHHLLNKGNNDEDNDPSQGGDDGSDAASMIQDMLLVEETERRRKEMEATWNDLAVVFPRGQETNADEENVSREFLTAMEILRKSNLASKSVVSLGLNKMPGIFLVSIERPVGSGERKPILLNTDVRPTPSNDHNDDLATPSFTGSFDEDALTTVPRMKPVSIDEPLKEGDILWFSGTAAAVGDLRKIPGMKSYVNEEVKKINEKVYDRRLVQAVIARRAKLVGKTVKEARFRTRFGAAVIAVHREGKRVQEHPGTIVLQAGDVLLLEAGPSFLKQNADNDNSFALLSEVEDSAPPRLKLLIPALLLAVAMLVVYTVGVASLLVCGLVTSMLMVMFGILSQQEVRDAINWEIYVTIASAFGIGTALTNSGVAGGIADGLVFIGQGIGIGDAGLFGAVYFATFLISNVVTNNAAAALLFPIAMKAAEDTSIDRRLMSFTLMLGASASFMSPFGYTTNLLIYGPGGYKYVDFLRIGTPMQIILWILTVVFIILESQWYISWIVTGAALVVSSIALTMGSSFFNIFKSSESRKPQSTEK